MKRNLAAIITAAAIGLIFHVPPAATADTSPTTPAAFSSAEGGGMYSKGARAAADPQVYHVTNLNDSGEGSFRDAVSQSGRMVVFDVSGMIDLSSNVSVKSNTTILGQTAPGDGICLRGNNVKLSGSDIIVRYLRFRVGDKLADGTDTRAQDGLEITDNSENVIVDHCSVSWGTDENLSGYALKNVTIQWSIIAEALNSSVHDKGEHSYAGIWGGVNLSVHHNLIATHKSRNPKIGTSETVSMTSGYKDEESLIDYRNNVFYNWGDKAGYGAENGARVNIVNNYYKAGPATPSGKRARIFELSPGKKYESGWASSIYANGNVIDTDAAESDAEIAAEVNLDNWSTSQGVYLASGVEKYECSDTMYDDYITEYPMNTTDAETAYTDVLENAGARLPRLDAVDERIIDNVINQTAPNGSAGSTGLVDSPSDGIPDGDEALYDDRGYPIWESESRDDDYDSDNDGICDEWEDAMGLDSSNPTDSLLIAPDGYTYLEIFADSPAVDDNLPSISASAEKFSQSDSVTLTVNSYTALSDVEIYDGGEYLGTALPVYTADNDTITFNQSVPDGCIAIAAAYDNGVLKSVQTAPITNGTAQFTEIDADSSVFVWDGFGKMIPLIAEGYNYSLTVNLDSGVRSISAKATAADGEIILPVKHLYVTDDMALASGDETIQSVSGDFDYVAKLGTLSSLARETRTGISIQGYGVAVGYDDSFEKKQYIGERGSMTECSAQGDYLKISKSGTTAKFYIGTGLADFTLVGEKEVDDETDIAAFVDGSELTVSKFERLDLITEKTSPLIKIANVSDGDRIDLNTDLNVVVTPDSNAAVSEIYVYMNGSLIASKLCEINEEQTVTVPLEFTSICDGTLTVRCFDNNLCCGEDSVDVVVSQDTAPWQLADIGDVSQKTYASATSDYTFKVFGGAGSVDSDSFGYMYQKFSGSRRLYCRLRQQDSDEFGIMIRSSLDDSASVYFFGTQEKDATSYVIKSGTAGNLTTVTADGPSGDKAFIIVEKIGSKLYFYQTENSTTVYKTKTLLAEFDTDLGDEYYMGFASCVSSGTNPPDAGWVGMEEVSADDENYTGWDFDNGADWLWQMQESNVLSFSYNTETIGDNSSGKMLISPDDNYTGERYIFREYQMSDDYVPQMSADVYMTGESPSINVYLQKSAQAAYRANLSGDSGLYTVSIQCDPDSESDEALLTIIDSDGNVVSEETVTPATDFRSQINTAKKTSVTQAVYFEPVYGADGKYYIDNISVTGQKQSYTTQTRILAFEGTAGEMSGTSSGDFTFTSMALSSAKSNTYGFTLRAKMTKKDSISVPVSGDAQITVYTEMGGSSPRYIVIDGVTQEITTSGGCGENVYDYTGDAKTITVTTTGNNYIYGMKVTEKTAQ